MGTLVVGGVVGPRRTKKTRRGWGWGGGGGGGGTQAVGAGGPAGGRAVFCMGRIRDEEEEGLGDVGSSSNRLKWSRDS